MPPDKDGGTGNGDGNTGDPNAQGGAGARNDDAQGGGGGDKKSTLSLDQALDALKETRGEAAKNRVENKKLREELDGLRTGLAKALGLKDDSDAGGDVKQLVEEIRGLKSKLETADRREAFRTVAKHVGADADLAWAYLTANGKLDDPEVDVEKALKAALKEKPGLKAQQPQRSGDPDAGGGGQKTRSMNAFIRRAAGR